MCVRSIWLAVAGRGQSWSLNQNKLLELINEMDISRIIIKTE